MVLTPLEKKYDDARGKALRDLKEFGFHSTEFKRSLIASYRALKELKSTHPKSFLLKKTLKITDWQNNDKK